MVTTKEERHERNSVAAGVAGRFTARIAISDDQGPQPSQYVATMCKFSHDFSWPLAHLYAPGYWIVRVLHF